MIKAVIFDLDDTLISERKYVESGYRHISKLLSSRFEKDEFEIYQSLTSLFYQSSKNVFNRFFDIMQKPYTKDDISRLVGEYRNHLPSTEFYNDVIPCLEKLKEKGLKLGIITDGYANAQRQKLKVLNAIDYFDKIIVTDELGSEYWKPHPKSFELMKDVLGVEFSNMVYVGDNVHKDFVTPNKLGMRTICINRENKIYEMNNLLYSEDFFAKSSIENLFDLLHLLELYTDKTGEY